MTPFITQVLQEILSRKAPISEYIFVLPSKRAGAFLLKQLTRASDKPVFAPPVLSIEEFTEDIAGLKPVDNITALFEFYEAYRRITPPEQLEDFDTFSSWGQSLMHDFNEIDRYLIDYKSFFGNLASIQEVKHWSEAQDKTPLMENYLRFWKHLPRLYEEIRDQLKQNDMAYQGMVYRQAAERIEEYIRNNNRKHIFIGFNALNAAEQLIFQRLLDEQMAEVFWDADSAFMSDRQHDVSLFMRKYKEEWPYYKKHSFTRISAEYEGEKEIDIIAVPKNVGQAKYVGELLAEMPREELLETAVVLGDESLLLPVLNSLPPGIPEINVTMGFGLRNAPVSFLFDKLLKMQTASRDSWYHKDVSAIIRHPLVQRITSGGVNRLLEKLRKENLVYVSLETVLECSDSLTRDLYNCCFSDWKNDPQIAVKNLQQLVYLIREKLDPERDQVGLEFLYQFHTLFNKLNNLLLAYGHVTSIKTLYGIYKELISTQTVDLKGKPFSGLQVMGVLESRVLDFKHVIVLSVNENVLPAGRSNNSFIPFDLKCAYDLPTYKEKDAVYAYHFYHLLHRATHAHLLYNAENGGLNGGEMSRFLLQLKMASNKNHVIRQYSLVPEVPAVTPGSKVIPKSPEIMKRLGELAQSGFSPSALTTYIRNPIDFYKQYVLKIREQDELEETVAYNTLGTVVHNTLEEFYKAWKGKLLTVKDLEGAFERIPDEVQRQFRLNYTSQPLATGMNLLIFEVAKRYVSNFLKTELKSLEDGNEIKILEVEDSMEVPCAIDGLDISIRLKGTVDRVDECNGLVRIIDYKTGKVDQNKVEVINWEDITSDYDKFSKPFQILMYTYMLHIRKALQFPVEAGIISFKNLQGGFLKFQKKNKSGNGAIKDAGITPETLEAFKEQLSQLIREIFDPEVPFMEKEIKQNTW